MHFHFNAGFCFLVLIIVGIECSLTGCNSGSTTDGQGQVANSHELGAESKQTDQATVLHEPDGAKEQGSDKQPSVDSLIQQGEKEAIAAKWNEARGFLTQALLLQPDNSRALFLSAQVSAGLGDFNEAIELLSAINPDDPQLGLASVGQTAQWLEEMDRFNEAKEKYKQAMRLAPDSTLVQQQYAQMLIRAGWPFQARDVLTMLVRSGEASEQDLHRLLKIANGITGEVGVPARPRNQALIWLDRRAPRRAIDVLNELIRTSSDAKDPFAYAVLANCYSELQQFDQMETIVASAPPGVRDFSYFWRAMGDRFVYDGNFKKAAGAYRHSLLLDTTDQVSYQRLRTALLELGMNKEANQVDAQQLLWIEIVRDAGLVGKGKRYDLGSGIELVSKLETVGHSMEAAAWLEKITARHASNPATESLQKQIANLAGTSPTIDRRRRECGLDEKRFPIPKLEAIEKTAKFASTGPSTNSRGALRKPPGPSTPARFVDVANDLGLRHRYLNATEPVLKNFRIFEGLGGGIAALDYDLDGNVDFYCAQAGFDPPDQNDKHSNVLYRLVGDRFISVQNQANTTDFHYTNCVTAGDINQDGFPDLVIGNLGNNRLLINQGDGTFADASTISNWDHEDQDHYTTGIAIADLSGDSLPDVIEMNYVNDPSMYQSLPRDDDGDFVRVAAPGLYTPEADQVWINQGDGVLHGQSLGSASGDDSDPQANDARPGLGLIVSNFYSDPGLEIFVANDTQPNQLWKRQNDPSESQNVHYRDVAIIRGCAVSSRSESAACMGVAWADFDGNLVPDLMITNWFNEWLNLYMFDAGGVCRDSAPLYRLDEVSEGLLGFGCQAIDYDNNSFVDAFITNGHLDNIAGESHVMKLPTQVLENRGDHFSLAEQSDGRFWNQDHVGRCAITHDFNRDGKLDLAVVDMLESVSLLENKTVSDHGWIQLELVGVESERDAIGTRVTITQALQSQSQVIATGDGYQGKNESIAHFGVLSKEQPLRVEVQWLNGRKSVFSNLAPNRRYMVVENESVAWGDIDRGDIDRARP